ncbi:unnamed protein product, partial [Pylaiella littoralis]
DLLSPCFSFVAQPPPDKPQPLSPMKTLLLRDLLLVGICAWKAAAQGQANDAEGGKEEAPEVAGKLEGAEPSSCDTGSWVPSRALFKWRQVPAEAVG